MNGRSIIDYARRSLVSMYDAVMSLESIDHGHCVPDKRSVRETDVMWWPEILPALLCQGQTIAPMPRLVFSLQAFQKLNFYYRTQRQEFQTFGLVDNNDNTFVVTEIVVNEQSVGFAHADLDEEAFPAFLDRLEREGKDITKLRFQAHSHGMIDAYFSVQDLRAIKGYACNWMISMVGNIRGNMRARLDIFEPLVVSIALPIFIQMDRPSCGQTEVWTKELQDRIR